MATTGMQRDQILRDILEKPNPLSSEQKAAVISASRYNRIIAGAGTGKTEALTRRIAYLLLIKEVPSSAIVAFTFTERAAKNMKSRIYDRVEHIAGENALTSLGEMYIGTIHSFSKMILEENFDFGNHQVFDENQEMAYLLRIGWNLGLGNDRRTSYSRRCADFLRCVNMVWGEMIDPEVLKKKCPDFYEKFHRYEAILSENRILTFGKMIHAVVLHLRKKPEAINYVKCLLVDEYQDVNRAQEELIELIGKRADIFAVGDPRQSIYHWRGSDEGFFQSFSQTFPEPGEMSLKENRRSLKRVVALANDFADSFTVRYEKLSHVRKDEGNTSKIEHESEARESEWIADQIQRIRAENKLELSDFGILLRSVRTSAAPLIAEFRRRGIPFIVGGKIGLFRRPESQALGRIFAWLYPDGFWFEDNSWNRQDAVIGDDLLQTSLLSWSEATRRENPPDCLTRLSTIKKNLADKEPPHKTFKEIYHLVLTSLGYQRLEPDDPLDAAIMGNLGRFNMLLADYETASRLGGRRANWMTDLKGLCWFMNSYASQAYEEQSSDEFLSVNAVKIMTVHQAKGLEWPVVFVPALLQKRFPSSMAGRELDWFDIPRDLFDARRYEGSDEDERKLFYVAITRSRDVLVLSSFRGKGKSSEFVSNFENDVISMLRETDPLSQLMIEGTFVDDELETFSAREIINYEICPQMYRFNEVWGYPPGFEEGLGFGENLHYCLQKASELVIKEGMTTISAIATAVDEHFHLPFVSGAVMNNYKKGAKRMLIEYAKKYGGDIERIEEMEYRLEFPMHNANIMGKVDVILLKNGRSEVREYKTSEEARSFDLTAAQVRLYALGLRKVGRRADDGSVAYLKEADLRPVSINEKELIEVGAGADNLLGKILSRDFRAKPGKCCLKCDFSDICRFRTTL